MIDLKERLEREILLNRIDPSIDREKTIEVLKTVIENEELINNQIAKTIAALSNKLTYESN